MKKERRIKKSQEFQRIIALANYVAYPSFVIYYDNKQEDMNRVGISVGKKLGNAVVRNTIKRQVRMLLMETGALSMDLDMIVIVRKGYLKNNYQYHKKCLETMLKKVKIKAHSDRKGEVET